jgi:hypothetical protein
MANAPYKHVLQLLATVLTDCGTQNHSARLRRTAIPPSRKQQILSIVFDSIDEISCLKLCRRPIPVRSRCRTIATAEDSRPRTGRLSVDSAHRPLQWDEWKQF